MSTVKDNSGPAERDKAIGDISTEGFSGYVRSSSSNDRSDYSLARAFKNAGAGIVYAVRTQRNVRVDLCFAAVAIVLAIVLDIALDQWALVILCIGIVLAFEVMNTAVEAVVDLVSPHYHILAKRAKDCAAGAVYLCAIASVFVAAFVYLPPILRLLGII